MHRAPVTAQELADGLNPELLHRHLDRYARLCCPVLDVFGQTYHWSIMQIEYSTDLVFKSEQMLAPLNASSATSDKQGGAIQRNEPPRFRVEKG